MVSHSFTSITDILTKEITFSQCYQLFGAFLVNYINDVKIDI